MIKLICCLLIATTLSQGAPEPKHRKISDFSKLVKTEYFVDKTLLLKEFLVPGGSPIVLVTAPNRFGKSANMDMVKRFCEIRMNKKGERVQQNATANYKLFVNSDLNIYHESHRSFFREHFGKYPVIHMDLTDVAVGSYAEFVVSIEGLVRKAYKLHGYLSEGTNASRMDGRDLCSQYFARIAGKAADEIGAMQCVKILSELLSEHFGQKVVILIDEYDAPLHKAIYESSEEMDLIMNFLRRFLYTSLKANAVLHHALVNGRVKEDKFIPLGPPNNFYHVPFMSVERYYIFYGLTVSEVEVLLKKFKLDGKMGEVQAWYGGYAGMETPLQLFCTGSVVAYLHTKKLKSYFSDTATFSYLRLLCGKLYTMRALMIDLVAGRVVYIKSKPVFDIDTVYFLKNIQHANKTSFFQVSMVYEYLSQLGLFKQVILSRRKKILKAPGEEIISELRSSIYNVKLFREMFVFEKHVQADLVEQFLHLENNKDGIQTLITSLRSLFLSIKMFPVSGEEFRTALHIVFEASKQFKVVRMGVPFTVDGSGAPWTIDLVAVTKERTGILLSLKHFRDLQQSTAKRGLTEIVERRYFEIFKSGEFKKLAVKKEIYIGIHVKYNQYFTMCILFDSRHLDDLSFVSTNLYENNTTGNEMYGGRAASDRFNSQ